MLKNISDVDHEETMTEERSIQIADIDSYDGLLLYASLNKQEIEIAQKEIMDRVQAEAEKEIEGDAIAFAQRFLAVCPYLHFGKVNCYKSIDIKFRHLSTRYYDVNITNLFAIALTDTLGFLIQKTDVTVYVLRPYIFFTLEGEELILFSSEGVELLEDHVQPAAIIELTDLISKVEEVNMRVVQPYIEDLGEIPEDQKGVAEVFEPLLTRLQNELNCYVFGDIKAALHRIYTDLDDED